MAQRRQQHRLIRPLAACKEISSVNICLFQQRQAVLSSGDPVGESAQRCGAL